MNAAAGPGPMHLRDSNHPSTTTQGCSICRVPSPPPAPRAPPSPPEPPLLTAADRDAAVTNGFRFRNSFATVFDLWGEGLTMPVAIEGCPCGRNCAYTGCTIAGYRNVSRYLDSTATTKDMLSLAPSLWMHVLQLPTSNSKIFRSFSKAVPMPTF